MKLLNKSFPDYKPYSQSSLVSVTRQITTLLNFCHLIVFDSERKTSETVEEGIEVLVENLHIEDQKQDPVEQKGTVMAVFVVGVGLIF
jgi:hypothetical protein